MSLSLELIIPVAVALYGMHQDDTCTITPSKYPLAENVCQGLRAGLHDGCKRLLSVPLRSGISLVGGYSVTPANFPPLVKKKIGEAYGACEKFWSGAIGFPEYRETLATKASVLNELFRAVNLTKQAERTNDSITAAGADGNAVKDTKFVERDLEKECSKVSDEGTDACLATPPSVPAPPVAPPPTEFKILVDEVKRLRAEVETMSKNVATLVPRQDSSLHASWTSVMQIHFDTGSHQVVHADCKRLRLKITEFGRRARQILIHGSADQRGGGIANDSLSMRRAAATATCLTMSKTGEAMMIQLVGTGALPTAASDYAQVRAATIFIAP
ncbi:hypothetical protein [Massilia sp. DD77]|uniref:hypothetical protein n=1 Tax=Massilia sp. DD77 TaxID=3109349 RepID=UPI002FFE0D2C